MEEGERIDGQFLCWGCGEFGQHCHVDQDDVGFDNSEVVHFSGTSEVKLFSCGASHNVVVTVLDEIFVWGNGNSGQLGCKTVGTRLEPTQIHLPTSHPRPMVKGVSCGGRHTLIWLQNGHVYSFGNNFYAQLGYDFKVSNYKANQLQPTLVKFLMYRQVRQVSTGDKHTVFLFSDGSVAAMGNNAHGQIGNESREESVVPCSVDIDKNVTYIASGANHNLAIADNGDVYVWGYSKGCGHRHHDLLTPKRILEGHKVVQVAGGGTHSMALTANGNIYSWGGGIDGQLGHRSAFLAHPKKIRDVQLAGQVVNIACGESFSAAVTVSGELFMWGKSSHTIIPGEKSSLRVNEITCINEAGKTPVQSVHCGAWHAAALTGKTDRSLTEEESEEEDSSDEDGTVSVVSQASVSGDSVAKVELLWEETELEIPVAPVSTNEHPAQVGEEDNTRLTLAEFYAPTPDIANKAKRSIQNHADAMTHRSHDSEGAKRLVVQVPISHIDPDNSSTSTPPRTPSRNSSRDTKPFLDQAEDLLSSSSNVITSSIPPQNTHIDQNKESPKPEVPRPRPAYNRSKTVAVDQGHHTVQISSHTANNYILPRENTKLISRNVSFVNATELRTTGPVYRETVSPTRAEDIHIVPNGDVHTVTIERQRQHLTAILKHSQQSESPLQPSPSVPENRIHRSKTQFAPLPGQITRGNTRFFYKKQPSLNNLATRNAQARARLLNPKALERMATVGWGFGGGNCPQRKPEVQDPSASKPVFSSAASWRERKDVLVNGTPKRTSTGQKSSKTDVDKEQWLMVNNVKQGKTVSPTGTSSVPVPGSIGRRNQLIKASSLSNISVPPRKSSREESNVNISPTSMRRVNDDFSSNARGTTENDHLNCVARHDPGDINHHQNPTCVSKPGNHSNDQHLQRQIRDNNVSQVSPTRKRDNSLSPTSIRKTRSNSHDHPGPTRKTHVHIGNSKTAPIHSRADCDGLEIRTLDSVGMDPIGLEYRQKQVAGRVHTG